MPGNFKIEPLLQDFKKIGLKELCKMAKTKEPGVRAQEKIEENKKFPVVVYIPKPYSQNYTPKEKGEIWEEKVLSKDWDPYSSKLRSQNSYSGWIQEAFSQLNSRQIPYY